MKTTFPVTLPITGMHCANCALAIEMNVRTARRDLKLDELRVVYPGTTRYPLGEGVEAVPLAECVAAK